MSETIERFPGVMVRCPGCGFDVSANQIPSDPERPFRCEACRARAHQYAVSVLGPAGGSSKGRKSNDEPSSVGSTRSAASRSPDKRNRKAEQEPAGDTLDDQQFLSSGDSGENREEPA